MSYYFKVLFLLIIIQGGFATAQAQYNNLFDEALDLIQDNFYDQDLFTKNIDTQLIQHCKNLKSTDEYTSTHLQIECILAELNDPHTRIINKQKTQTRNKIINKKGLQGFGLILSPIHPRIIQRIVPNSSADKAGLKANDQLTSINNIPVEYFDHDEIIKLIETPSDITAVKLNIKRGEYYFFDATLRSTITETHHVKTQILKNNILYLKLNSFLAKDLTQQVINILNNKTVQETNGIIIDLKHNTGGLLINGIKVAGLFLPEQKIVSIIKDNQNNNIKVKTTKDGLYLDKPVVLLIDKYSASSSEILIAALKENNRALIIGEPSYGKGSIQKIFNLSDGSSLNVTVRKFYTPLGEEINLNSIEPDYYIDDLLPQIKASMKYILKN